MKFKLIIFLFLFSFVSLQNQVEAQTNKQISGWAASFNSIKINQKFGIHFDLQFRSADELSYIRNILIRPGLTYQIDKTKNATIGYALILTDRGPDFNHDYLSEHRIWEQFIINVPIVNKVSLANRLRLEQRFINRPLESVFSQRARYFARAIIPLEKQSEQFKKGIFIALQNEIFINLSNKKLINNHLFDQNRFFLATGYRVNPKLDLELGYMRVDAKGVNNNTINNTIQIGVYSKF
jgi:hypothetical protein